MILMFSTMGACFKRHLSNNNHAYCNEFFGEKAIVKQIKEPYA